MPHFDVRIREEALDGSVEPKLIRGLAEAVASVYGERFFELAAVEIFGIPDGRWGVGGAPSRDSAPVITLRLREAAFAPEHADKPARLIAAVTDAAVAALGEEIRKRVTVILVPVPPGRSGVGGEVV
ncbi:tautomerase family protein [Streptomyces sp. NPDC048172]|uniref:tautomerase family protein n=1 Tax=Streptomyces sp. NPDC048172 TaxID=3365505 RepID=UPI0037143938